MKAKKILLPFAILIIAFFYSCAKDNFVETDGVCPLVTVTNPDNGAINVPLNKVITATFNEKMNPLTIGDASFLVAKSNTQISGNVTYSDSTAVFTPTSPLDYNTVYTGTIRSLVTDVKGNALQQDYVWAFTTILPIKKYLVDTSSSPTAGGVTSGGGSFDDGTSVTVTATPNTGYNFVNWTSAGTAVSTNLTYTFVLSANATLVANFEAKTYTLNVTAQNGTVLKNPDAVTYNGGDTVQLTATPNSGYEFTFWSGDATGTTNPLTVLMNANKNITANFSLITSVVCTPAVDLGTAGNYAILAESGISTTGTTSITGDMGISPAAATFITGFGLSYVAGSTYSTSSLVTGKIYAPGYANPTPSNLVTAVNDMHTAFTTGNGLAAGTTELLSGNLNGQTLAAGIYKWSTGLSITNGITLDGGGDPCAMFVFQISQDLTVANNTIITLANGAKPENIYWLVAGSGAVLGTTVQFQGNILSKTLISVNTGSTVNGKLLAQTAVTLKASTIVKK
ncbi:hypothetical protein KCTC32516_01634 [Polaribacter huanghezhanensis]|uniref:ice-binding family protein n=1 Tax=Polaribacter huanghezhanensis TaxID=1354726 RepID=UPI0026476515|nr:ice-binding family protein [Polaribacter huanghezhanensis]WKD86268.1 hypothetical protein KCTC32516_01634 [Polaribacter huanghezhanensis]